MPPCDFQYWQTCLETRTHWMELLFSRPSSVHVLVFSSLLSFPPKYLWGERIRGRHGAPATCTWRWGWDKGVRARESFTRFKRRRLTPSRNPFRRGWCRRCSGDGVVEWFPPKITNSLASENSNRPLYRSENRGKIFSYTIDRVSQLTPAIFGSKLFFLFFLIFYSI